MIFFQSEIVGRIIPKSNFFANRYVSVEGLPELPCVNRNTPFFHRLQFSDALVLELTLKSGKLLSLYNTVSLTVSKSLLDKFPWLVPAIATEFYSSAMLE